MNSEVREAVEQSGLRVLHWHDNNATVECPGASLHTTGGSDATLFTEPFLYVHCFHESCRSILQNFNCELADINDRLPDRERPKPTPAQLQELEFKRHLKRIKATSRQRLLPNLPERDEAFWRSRSPFPLHTVSVKDHYRLFFKGLFKPDDILWCGETTQCEKRSLPRRKISPFAVNFRTAREWADLSFPYGQQTSLVSFTKACLSNGQRRKEWVHVRYYHVLESDRLSKPKAGGVLEWAQRYVKLRAIIDTGGKSWHGLFEPPAYPIISFPPKPQQNHYVKHLLGDNGGFSIEAEENTNYQSEMEDWKRCYSAAYERNLNQAGIFRTRLREFYAMAEGLECDRNMLRTSLTVRCPGHERLDADYNTTGKMQRLIYLDPLYSI